MIREGNKYKHKDVYNRDVEISTEEMQDDVLSGRRHPILGWIMPYEKVSFNDNYVSDYFFEPS